MRKTLAVLLFGFISIVTVTAQDPQPNDPEVLTKGPIHEAFANTASATPQPGPLAPKAPPEPIEELPPEEKPEGEVVFIPGYWSWDDDRNDFIWISGFWRDPPPGRQWVPGTWRQAGDAWQWTSGFWAGAQQEQIEYVPPPPAPLETAASTPAPGENYLYAPGNWVYQQTRYVWRPGFWYPYRADWIYVPAHYCWTPCGYVFVDGYWDYPLRRRGVLFAPVYFTAGVYTRPAFVYRPRYVVYDDALYGCLFVRPGFSAYYFGDYFDVRYRSGYRSWFDVRVGVGAYDPLWGYYRTRYAATPGWSVGITTLYAGRYNGSIARPPVTYVQQTNVINNINKTTVINNTNVNIVKNVTLAAPINKVDKTVVNLQPVSAAQQKTAVQAARDVRKASAERVRIENQVLTQIKPAGPGQPAVPAQPIKVSMPQSPAKNPTPPPLPPSVKDAPKSTLPKSKDAPKSSPKDSPKAETPKSTPKATPKETPKTPPPLPKDTPKAPLTPKDGPKETPKTPPPLPKETPKTPSPQPKETPKTPPPLPKETPKTPPPIPKETPKTPSPAPKAPSTPSPAPKIPQSPPPIPKTPPSPPPAPKAPPPAPKTPPKGKDKDKGSPPTSLSALPSQSSPRPVTPTPVPAVSTASPPTTDKPSASQKDQHPPVESKRPADKKGDRSSS